ncbi:MAG: transglycosylase SLT domain-containing protein [Rugosibacter sp.]|nr:transglycosylase SLT domain-containing protein [Rugosibacter sp.]
MPKLFILFLCACCLAACRPLNLSPFSQPLPAPEKMGELVVAIRNAPGFYQPAEGAAIEQGFDADLITAFAHQLGVKPRWVVAEDVDDLRLLVKTGRAHMAANYPIAEDDLRHSQPVLTAGQAIISHNSRLSLDRLADLQGKSVAAAAGSPLAGALRQLPEKSRPMILEIPQTTELKLLEQLAQDRYSLVAVHDINFEIANNFYPDLILALKLPGKTQLGWAFPPVRQFQLNGPFRRLSDNQSVADLPSQANAFIDESRRNGLLDQLRDRYFGHINRISTLGIAQFIDDMQRLLPGLRRHFWVAQQKTGIDWRLLASLAYQESHWDPFATSPTNVRGIMMLTEDTADALGVSNRLDVASSILGGARYLAQIMAQLPPASSPQDQLWLALAGYNLGAGHLRGALAIAKDMQRDPTSWYEMKKVLPLLSRPEVYDRLKAGPARGGEAVILVENIRIYYDILKRFEPADLTFLMTTQTNAQISGKRAEKKKIKSNESFPSRPSRAAKRAE